MKRIFTFFFALMSACTFSAYAAVVDGTCGDNLTWTLNTKDSTLVISGTGAMADYDDDYSLAPWSDYKIYIKYVTLPDGLTSIGEWAFESCLSLTSITIPNSVTSIGKVAFQETGIFYNKSYWENGVLYISNCLIVAKDDISGAYIIKEGTRVIADEAFCDCSGLTSVTLGNSVTSIGNSAFESCSSLTSITIPNSVTSIGDEAFYRCSGLTSVTLGNSVTSIGEWAFLSCSGLTSITIPNSVKSIGVAAFAYCSGLTSITLGNSLTSIGNEAFSDCSSLAVVNVEATTPPTLGTNAVFSSSPTCNIPCGTLDVYQASDWQNFVGEFMEQCSDDSGDDGDMDKDLTIVFSDRDNNQISAQTITLSVPLAPEIAGFTFLYWLPVAEPVEDVITLQAVYGSNTPTEAPEVYVNLANPAQKLIRNGQVYILHEEKMYTISGQVVK